MSDRVTLTQLRKLAKQALGKTAGLFEAECFENEHRCTAGHGLFVVTAYGDDKPAARRQLRDLLERIIASSGTDEYDRGYCDGKDGRHG